MAELNRLQQIINTIIRVIQDFTKDYKGHLHIKIIICKGSARVSKSSDGLFHAYYHGCSYPVRVYKSDVDEDFQKMLMRLSTSLASLADDSNHQILAGNILIRANRNEKCDTIYLEITDDDDNDVSILKKNIEIAIARLNSDKD